MTPAYYKFRDKLVHLGLWPESRLARIACYFAGLAATLFVLQKLLSVFAPRWGEHLNGWVGFLVFVAAVFFAILGFGWLRRRLLWRLRNRLIVTYVFIGVIPVVLLASMAFITLYLFAGQFAGFIVISDLNSEMRSAEAGNAAIANELAARLDHGEKPTSNSLEGLKTHDPAWQRRRVCAWSGDSPLPLCEGPRAGGFSFPEFLRNPDNSYAKDLRQGQPFDEMVRDQDRLYLRVANVIPLRAGTLTVITSEEIDKDLISQFAHNLGEITLYAAGLRLENSNDGAQAANPQADKDSVVVIRQGKNGISADTNPEVLSSFTVGSLPPASGAIDHEIQFGTPLHVIDWHSGAAERMALVRIRTRPSALYGRLFASLGDFATGVEYILLAVGIFFALIELIALFTGTRMTRTVTRAIAELHDATRHVDRGDFSHRIPIRSHDQLADLALSFNSMTTSIEKLILEQKEKQRLENELSIAQEVQAQLFPREISELESLEVHGFCRPARTVSGDYYDFLTASSHKMILAVGDISGKGISAALLMATIHSAVRAYSVESLPQAREPIAVGSVAGNGRMMASFPEGIELAPSQLLALLNHQLFVSTPPEKYATLFLGIYDGLSHRLTYSNGGHLPPILIGKDGALRRLEAGGTVVGLFDDMSYDEGSVQMHAGEVFVAYSDGITEPENDFGEFGEDRLIDIVRQNRHSALPQISQAVTLAVDDWIGDNEQPDDVTLVLARAR